jgi:hypothetical protein
LFEFKTIRACRTGTNGIGLSRPYIGREAIDNGKQRKGDKDEPSGLFSSKKDDDESGQTRGEGGWLFAPVLWTTPLPTKVMSNVSFMIAFSC